MEVKVEKGREVVDLPRALSRKARKRSVRNRHRGRKVDEGEEMTRNLIAESPALRGVEEPVEECAERKRILS